MTAPAPTFLARLRTLLAGTAPAPRAAAEDGRIAVAALLVEAARMDTLIDGAERETIERLLAERYGLPPDEVRLLVSHGERRAEDAVELFQFTRRLVPLLDEEERTALIEMLWEVALADGALHPLEDSLIRRIAGLIYVSDQARGAARQRVLARRGGGD